MKKTNTFFKRMALFAIACCCSAVSFGQTIEISTEADLKAIVNNLDGDYKLMNDITLTGDWTPIGTKYDVGNQQAFKGGLDGNGHVIYNLRFKNTGGGEANNGGGQFAGLFGGTQNAIIKNLGVEQASVAGHKQVGVIVGIMYGGLIENCYVTNSYVESEDHVGAIAGQINNGAIVQNCYANAHVYSRSNQAGGLVGVFNNNDTKISKCYFSGMVRSVNNRPSGIVTLVDYERPTIENCVNLAPFILGPENLRIVASNDDKVNIRSNYSLSSTLLSGNKDDYNGSTTSEGDGNYGENKRHGANIPGGDQFAKETSFYETTLGWDFTDTWKFLGDGYPVLKWQEATIRIEAFNMAELYSLRETDELDFSNLKFNQAVDFTLSTTSDKLTINGKKITIKSSTTILSPEDVQVTIEPISSDFECTDKVNIILLPTGVVEISTADQLKYLEVHPEGDYKLTADIDMTGVDFKGLCSTGAPFKGTLDGNGHIIKNFTINTNNVGVGLINATDGATIKKLGIEGASVKGDKRTGTIVGQMRGGILEECYVIDSYAESSDHVGALVGTAIETIVQNSYATSNVRTRDNQAGGLIGVTENTKVSKCFFSGTVYSARTRANGIVGLVDRNEDDKMIVESCVSLAPTLTIGSDNLSELCRIINLGSKSATLLGNYALSSMLLGKEGALATHPSSEADDVDGADVSKEDALKKSFYEGLGWNFTENGQWKMLANGYPVLAWQATPVKTTLLGNARFTLNEGETLDLKEQLISSHGLDLSFATINTNVALTDGKITIAGGELSSKDVADVTVTAGADAGDFTILDNIVEVTLFPSLIEISTAEDLAVMAENLSGNYKLVADVALSGNWTPVGTFTGTLDGNGHVISGLSYTSTDRDDLGLFSRIENATIKNLGLENVNINVGNQKTRVGAIAANMVGGIIEECYVTGELEGRQDVGSIVGIMDGNAILRNSYSTATKAKAADQEAGGLVGTIRNATVENSYFAGNANSWRNVSGIVGRADADGGTVQNTVCLSPELTSNANVPFRIINANNKTITLSGNYSLSTTTVGGVIVDTDDAAYGADKEHGANITGGDEKAKDAAFYTDLGWDLTNVWMFKTGVNYPVLKKFEKGDPTSIQAEVGNSQIRYNVVNGVLTMTGLEDGSHVAIYSISGQLVSVIKSTNEVNYQFLTKGIYVVKVTSEKAEEIIKVINL